MSDCDEHYAFVEAVRESIGDIGYMLTEEQVVCKISAIADERDQFKQLLQQAASAMANYRHHHDHYGRDDIRTGRAWDVMRRIEKVIIDTVNVSSSPSVLNYENRDSIFDDYEGCDTESNRQD